MKKITVSDYTLRKIAEEGSSALLFREKTAMAAGIDTYGADIIELPPVKNFKEDRIICHTICDCVNDAVIAIPCGNSSEEIEQAFECISNAKKPCLQVALPVSTVQMEYRFHLKGEKMLARISSLVAEAKKYCDNVEFVAQDATRADDGYLEEAFKVAIGAGATCLTICDDAGVMLPDEFAALVSDIKGKIDLPVYVQVSNNLNLANGVALYAIKAGADGIKASIIGEDTLKIGKLAKIINAKSRELGVETNLKLTEIQSDVNELISKMKSFNDQGHEELASSGDIFLDSNSSLSQIEEAIVSLGYDLSSDDLGKVADALKALFEKKNSVGAKELEAIIASYALQAASTYHLDKYLFTSGNQSGAVANITLIKDGEKLVGVAGGDGPIDSSFHAIENIVGYHYELDKFTIEAVTEGKEALGSAVVRLRSNTGKLYSGTGISTDIVGASVRAYINALNKIVSEEN